MGSFRWINKSLCYIKDTNLLKVALHWEQLEILIVLLTCVHILCDVRRNVPIVSPWTLLLLYVLLFEDGNQHAALRTDRRGFRSPNKTCPPFLAASHAPTFHLDLWRWIIREPLRPPLMSPTSVSYWQNSGGQTRPPLTFKSVLEDCIYDYLVC